MNERPTSDQWVGISELTRHLAVTAGAGTGKTWVLTERYLSMLLGRAQSRPPDGAIDRMPPPVDFANPSDIVAITFTKEAASEMRRRIRARLRDCLREERNVTMCRQIERWTDEIEAAPITTIHGFCGSLLRRFPLAAGIDPQAVVLEPYEAAGMLRNAIHTVIDEGLNAFDEAIVNLTHQFGAHPLRRALERTYNAIREQTEQFQSIADVTREAMLSLSAEAPTAVEQFIHAVDLALAFGKSDETVAKGARERAWSLSAIWPSWRALFEQMATSGEYSDAVHDAAVLLTGWGNCGKAMKPYVEALKERFAALQRCAHYKGDSELTQAMCELLRKVHVAYEQEKQRRTALDFTDLQAKAVALLSDEVVCRQVANSTRYLLVDEFQDTNPMQATLLHRLMSGNHALKVFMVGDGKQSIYRFRGADVEVFTQAQDELLAQGGKAVSLRHNFRTQEPIVQFINGLFGNLMPAIASEGSKRLQYEPMEATRCAAGGHKTVEIAHFEPIGSGIRSRVKEARFIAHRIQAMVGKEACVVDRVDGTLRTAEYGDVALLFSAMTHVSTYERAFQEAGVPYYVVGSRAFYRRQEVIDLLQVLRAIVSPDDVLAHIAFLRSPLGGVSDEGLYWLGTANSFAKWDKDPFNTQRSDEEGRHVAVAQERLLRWRQERLWRTPAALIERIVEETAYDHILLLQQGGEQKVGNLRKLCQMAEEQTSEYGATLVDFVHFLDHMLLDEVDEEDEQVQMLDSNAVKIMTIHKSKGLEFPIVFVPQLHRRMAPSTEAVIYTAGRGMVVRRRDVAAAGEVGLARELRERENEREREEFVRQFYVALTRARDMLVVSGAKKEHSPLKYYADTSNWMDWLLGAIGDGTVAGLQSIDRAFPMVQVTALGNSDETEETFEHIDDEMSIAPTDAAHCADEQTSLWRKGSEETLAALDAARDQTEIEERARTPLLWDESAPAIEERRAQNVRNPLSVTSLLNLNACERLYYYEHVIQVPAVTVQPVRPYEEIRYVNGVADQENQSKGFRIASNVRGTIVHKAIECLVLSGNDARAAIQTAIVSVGIDGIEDKCDDWVNDVLPHVEQYRVSALAKSLEEATIVRELPFQAQFDAFVLSGTIDCLAILPDGRAMIVDYKTNAIGDDDHLKRTVEQYAPQLQLYAKVVQDVLGLPIARAVLYFTAIGQEVDVPHGEGEMTPLLTKVASLLQRSARGANPADYERTTRLERCTLCQHRFLCGR